MAKFYYGGQAVIEGVMMRGRKSVAAAIRRPGGSIYLYEEALNPRLYQNRLFRLPFLRGVFLLWEMLVLGTRLMTFSANIATGAIDPAALPSHSETSSTRAANTQITGNPTATLPEKPETPPQIGGAALALTLLVSLGFAIAVFFLGPLLYLIGRVPDIQRVFGYHGAEHKAINAMEHGEPLDIPHVRQASRVHTRCGTGFLLLVVVVSIVVFAFVGSPSLLVKVVSRVLLLPVVAGVAYELMRLGAANYRYRIVRWLLAPGLALQGLTTREPDDSMIECAIAALNRVLRRDELHDNDGEGVGTTLPPLIAAR